MSSKSTLLIIALLLLPVSAWAAFPFVQSDNKNCQAAATTCALNSHTYTTGNTILVMAGPYDTSNTSIPTVSSVTDSQGNTYTEDAHSPCTNPNEVSYSIWYSISITGFTGSVTAHFNNVSTKGFVGASEFQQIYQIDSATGDCKMNGAAFAGSDITPNQAPNVVYGGLGLDNSQSISFSAVPGAPWVDLTSSVAQGQTYQYQSSSASAVSTNSYSWSGASTNNWAAHLAAFDMVTPTPTATPTPSPTPTATPTPNPGGAYDNPEP